MKKEVDYLVEHGFAVPSFSRGVHPVCWSKSLMAVQGSARTLER